MVVIFTFYDTIHFVFLNYSHFFRKSMLLTIQLKPFNEFELKDTDFNRLLMTDFNKTADYVYTLYCQSN